MLGCPKNPDAPDITFKGKPFITDSRTASIVRKENGKLIKISASSPAFDNRIVWTLDEYQKHLEELNALSWQCEKWKPGTRFTIEESFVPLEGEYDGDF